MLSALVVAVILASCGGGDSGAGSESANGLSSGVAVSQTGNESGSSDIPAVEVTDLATGTMVDLSTLAPSDKSVLLWFWAPH